VTEPIAEVREKSIVTADGKERPIDVMIFGTGFHATVLLHGARVIGRGGVSFADAFQQSRSAFLGVTVRGFPNLFMLLGPNTGLGHNSVVLMIEAQIRYVMSCLDLMRRKGCPVMEVRESSQKRFGDFLRRRLAGTVWQAGRCRSWYQDPATGENPTIWPGSVGEYQRRTRSASARDYELSGKA
jgi:cation diffusion facilitator CzcD-associated flavoprotein CzcO